MSQMQGSVATDLNSVKEGYDKALKDRDSTIA